MPIACAITPWRSSVRLMDVQVSCPSPLPRPVPPRSSQVLVPSRDKRPAPGCVRATTGYAAAIAGSPVGKGQNPHAAPAEPPSCAAGGEQPCAPLAKTNRSYVLP